MDDIQFVVGTTKVGSEQEFFYTFNALFGNNKQIVLTSDKTPQELQLEPRMSSRLMSGIVAEIKLPTVETRIAILRQNATALILILGMMYWLLLPKASKPTYVNWKALFSV